MDTITERDRAQHAIDNARRKLAEFVRLHAAYQEAMLDSDKDCDRITDEAREQALSVQVRTDWHDPSDPPSQPGEGCILLTAGGPALRLLVDLDSDAEPIQTLLEYQDWGLPWTDLPLTEQEQDACDWFAGLFSYGVPQ